MKSTRGTTVLAISRQLGSGGSFIGQLVAHRLGLHYADRDILHEAALALGVEDAAVEPLEERVEGFWERVAHMFARGPAEGLYAPLDLPAFDQADLFALESRIMQQMASREDAVIVGRGGAHVLREHPGLISIFVHGAKAVRVRSVMQTYHLTDEAEAATLVHRSDRQRAQFIEGLTGRSWTDASLYDLCLDTTTVGLEAAGEIVTGIVARRLERDVAASS
jgi:cytidylate kinase